MNSSSHIARRVIWRDLGPSGRPPMGSQRTLLTVVGVVVLLIAAIAFANRPQNGDAGDSAPPAASGDALPANTHSKLGAQSAAARYASALGGEGMFNKPTRNKILQAFADPEQRDELQRAIDADYSAEFNKRIGLDANGRPPKGTAFVARSMPAGTIVKSFGPNKATVDVWCAGLFGLTGGDSEIPVETSWFTMTMRLRWTDGGWKVSEFTQKDGPSPAHANEYGQAPPL